MERVSYYNKNIKFDRKALTEVYEILKEYEEEIDEIPEKYLWVIEDNMDKDYVFIIDDFETIELRKDTKKIITYLYTNFLSTTEERTVLKQLEKIQYEKRIVKENELKQEIAYPIFNKNKLEEKVEIEERNNNNLPMEYKEPLFKNILNKIKDLLRNMFRK